MEDYSVAAKAGYKVHMAMESAVESKGSSQSLQRLMQE